ncbi:MAG TPA: hypothetical protein PLL35_03585 [Candidatus Cloacimonas sp.]|nr:hypothetical protein [Candidatus Cloacimonas sp.]
MKHPYLTGIGKLGRQNADGFHPVMIKPEYRTIFSELEELYLIFSSDRVFFVTISERMRQGNKTWIKLMEDGVSEEQYLHRDTVIAIEETEQDRETPSLNYIIGYQVLFAGEELGIVEDFFFNGAQDVLQIVNSKGTEYLVPFVDYYIDAVIDNPGCVILQNALELISFYQTLAKK